MKINKKLRQLSIKLWAKGSNTKFDLKQKIWAKMLNAMKRYGGVLWYDV